MGGGGDDTPSGFTSTLLTTSLDPLSLDSHKKKTVIEGKLHGLYPQGMGEDIDTLQIAHLK